LCHFDFLWIKRLILPKDGIMKTRLFRLDSYISHSEQFHFARKHLEPREPPFLHRHDYFELFLVERGATWHLFGGQRDLLERGAMVFVRPDDAHAFCADAEAGCQIINLMFRIETARHLEQRYAAELGQRFFWSAEAKPETHLLRGPRLERAINSAHELQTSRRTLARVEQFLLYIMTRVVDYSATLPSGTPHWLVTACTSARQPEVFRDGVPGFVKISGRGHEHVCRSLKKHLGMAPSAYINRIRMEHAAMRLGSEDASFDEIAADCGIENLSYFYRLFREHYGTTPRKYRLRHLADPIQPL
jgi:AraC family cel operon transcriptional repressor